MRSHLWACALSSVLAAACHRAELTPSAEHRAAASSAPAAGEDHDFIVDHRFHSGESASGLRLHYTTLGKAHRGAGGKIDNAVLMLHWTSASGAALQTPEFSSFLYASGKPLDASKYFLIFVDNLGHGRSSKPSDGLHARFPRYGYRDLVELQHELVHRELGIDRLHAIVGLSMGGMHAWQWAESYPDEVEGILPVVSLPTRIAGRNLIWRRIVSRSIRTDPEWLGGDYAKPPRGWLEAFPLFRMMLDGVPRLQEAVPDRVTADAFVQSAVEQARTMDANDVLFSLESSEDYDPEAQLEAVRAKVYALNFGDDEFNPVELDVVARVQARLPRARFVTQPGTVSSFGHLTQAHPSLWADHVGKFMSELEAR